MRQATYGRIAAACFTLGLAPLALANETQAPVVSKRHVSPGETHALNPQPIPPGKSATATKTSKSGEDRSIIFVGGKKAVATKPKAKNAAPSQGKAMGSAKLRTPPGPPT